MAMSGHQVARRLILGRAQGPAQSVWDDLEAPVEDAHMQRKGRLLVLCSGDTDRAALTELYERYFQSSSFDVLPSLSVALAGCYGLFVGLVHDLPLVAVAFGLEVYLVGGRSAAAWMLHHDQVKGVLGVGQAEGRAIPLGEGQSPDGEAWSLWGSHQRLMIGDTLVLSTSRVSDRTPAEAIGALARGRRSPQDLAHAVSRAAGRAGREPALVIQAGGFSSVPGFAGPQRPVEPSAAPLARARRATGERSPIWAALMIAVVAVGISLWIRRPTIPRDDLREWVELLLTPRPMADSAGEENQAPTAQGPLVRPTPPLGIHEATRVAEGGAPEAPETAAPRNTQSSSPTSSATPRVHSAPSLLSPSEGESVGKTYVTLDWEWDGELGEDEYFDVRLWRLGTPKQGIAWTKRMRYVERSGQSGWHTWTVAVIRGRDGVVLEEYVMAPEVNFSWVVKGGSQPQISPIPPTRAAPAQPPTRTLP